MLLTLLLQASLLVPMVRPAPRTSVQTHDSVRNHPVSPLILQGAPYDINVKLSERASPLFPLSSLITIVAAVIAAGASLYGVYARNKRDRLQT
jgi:hypothetical protein